MQKNLAVDETIYDGLAYAQMAADETREAEALEWSDTLVPDVSDGARRSRADLEAVERAVRVHLGLSS